VFVRVLALCLFSALAASSPARADDALSIGVMNDQSGPYAAQQHALCEPSSDAPVLL
jgi:hypothetical protein